VAATTANDSFGVMLKKERIVLDKKISQKKKEKTLGGYPAWLTELTMAPAAQIKVATKKLRPFRPTTLYG
jgi:hypothetical protein